MSEFHIRFFSYAPLPIPIPGDLIVESGDRVIAEFLGHRETGELLLQGQAIPLAGERVVEDRSLRILRFVSKNDQIRITENERLARLARTRFLDILLERGLRLVKVIDAHYSLGRERLILRVTSPEDIDLRAESTTLQQQLKTHVDLRKINPRDATIMLGGIGECGRTFCCCSMKNPVGNVSLRMARAQSANASPAAFQGACGKLRCCLRFEHDNYQRVLQKLPARDTLVMTPNGRGRVKDHRILQERVIVALDSGRTACYPAADITPVSESANEQTPTPVD